MFSLDVVELLENFTKHFEAVDAADFRLQVHPYLTSDIGSGSRGADLDGVEGRNRESMLWPLVTKVQIRCSSPILSTGLVVVDLPGEADANLARRDVGKKYKKKCNHMGIVTHAVRAKDDGTAHRESLQASE